MNIITHFLTGWAIGEATSLTHRDRSIIALAAVAPDLDGLGVIVDLGNRVLSRPESFWFAEWHHQLLHGLPGAILIGIAAALLAKARSLVFFLAFAVVHLHLVCDFLGSRGPSPDDIWPINYLAPISSRPELAWSGQWALNAWPNILFTLLLLVFAFIQAITTGRSPVSVFHQGAHIAFVDTVKRRWGLIRGAA